MHTFVVPILGHERGLSASVIGAILGGFAVAATVIRLILPLLVGRLQEWQVITGAMLLTSLLLGIYPFTQEAWAMAVCSVLLGLSLGSVLSTGSAVASRLASREASQALPSGIDAAAWTSCSPSPRRRR